jgi:hypothetical protein
VSARPHAGVIVVRAWIEDGVGLRARITSSADVDAPEVERRPATSEEEIHEAVREWLSAVRAGGGSP